PARRRRRRGPGPGRHGHAGAARRDAAHAAGIRRPPRATADGVAAARLRRTDGCTVSSMRLRRIPKPANMTLNLAPMVDVMMCLIIFFLLGSRLVAERD